MEKAIYKAASTISRLVPTLMSGVELRYLSKVNITSSQLVTVMTVFSLERCSMGQLAESLYVKMPTVTGIINRLAKQRFVKRSRSEQDRRKVYIELTPKGEGLVKEMQSLIHRRWERLLSALTLKEVDSFQSIMVKLYNYIKAQRAENEK